ncbi:Borealin-lik [Cordyceps fumosorosea ARSEF 2679]|uniref:Borealin-lik n=1 Tax=Cordyceps fumosorosea (strain ARSEF 2679) TaxID=1081104 RepID=A0A167XG12_CORFA|nr:Borealin-lik [Cordyceps fumosorosea ARSEF 2679]OAA64936.1 Borealin-lik [Cordyceps fumosorosea ARSEF 2679]
MAPARSKKRGSDQSTASTRQRGVKVPVKEEPTTPTERSPIKRRKAGITLHQKQTLIQNLQLEITERARRLRAQYHLQAQGLRSRIEIRINRIPTALRKMKMGDLLIKYINQEQAALRPPVPAKDGPPGRSTAQKQSSRPNTARSNNKRFSTEISGGDKENEIDGETMKKRVRAAMQDNPLRPTQILSPTSSNCRVTNREIPASPARSYLNRPGSPLKVGGARSAASATTMLSNMVEKAKAARAASTRKTTTSSAASSRGTAAPPASAAKTRRGAPARQQPSRPATRTGRRVSAHSETSEASNGTVVRKPVASKASTATAKKSVMGSIRKGVASSRATAPTTSSSGRVLRKRT